MNIMEQIKKEFIKLEKLRNKIEKLKEKNTDLKKKLQEKNDLLNKPHVGLELKDVVALRKFLKSCYKESDNVEIRKNLQHWNTLLQEQEEELRL